MKKKQINKKLKLGSMIISITTIAIFSFLLINGIINPKVKEENVSLYDYTINPQANYKVFLKPNILYGEKTLPEGETYFTEFLNTIDATFNYQFTGDREADIKGTYDIVAIAEGYSKENDKIQTLWKKEFPVVPEQSFNKKDKSISIDKNIKFDLNKYNEFSKSVSEASKTSASSKVSLIMNVNLQVTTDKGVIEEKSSPSIVIPLEESQFIIDKVGVENKKDSIKETKEVEAPVSEDLIMIYSIILMIALAILIYMIGLTKTRIDDNNHMKQLNKIFKNHGTRLVALDKGISSNYQNNYRMRTIEDLVRVADEIEKPIMYRYSTNPEEIKEFYVVDDYAQYIFNLENYIGDKEKMIKSKNI